MDARDSAMAQTPHAPLGAPWNSPTASAPSAKPKRKFKTAKVSYKTPAKKKKEPPPPPPFFGDKVLADEGCFKYDAFISREMAVAAAQGDVGRVWETFKVYFHPTYLVCGFEFELGHGVYIRGLVTCQIHQLRAGNGLRS
jgi:hypothetical protein